MPRTDPSLFAGLPYRRLSPAQRAALAARLVGCRPRPDGEPEPECGSAPEGERPAERKGDAA